MAPWSTRSRVEAGLPHTRPLAPALCRGIASISYIVAHAQDIIQFLVPLSRLFSSSSSIMVGSTVSSDAGAPKALWRHPRPEQTEMFRFKQLLEKEKGIKLNVGHVFPDSTSLRGS
jgi:hypothetical protein